MLELETLVEEQNASATDAPFGIYHGLTNEQDDDPIEICVPVSGEIKGKGDVAVRQLEGGNAPV